MMSEVLAHRRGSVGSLYGAPCTGGLALSLRPTGVQPLPECRFRWPASARAALDGDDWLPGEEPRPGWLRSVFQGDFTSRVMWRASSGDGCPKGRGSARAERATPDSVAGLAINDSLDRPARPAHPSNEALFPVEVDALLAHVVGPRAHDQA